MPRDTATNNFLIELKNAVDKNVWFRFGLTDNKQEGVWMWDDNVPLGDFRAWGPEEPGNQGGNEDCAEYFPESYPEKSTWNDGPCTKVNRKFICQVLPSYINKCRRNPCQHGRCENQDGGYKCTCSPGWTGKDCQKDIDECAGNPCQHGSCVKKDGGYKCTCSPGWTGQNCQQAKKRTRNKKLGNTEYKVFAEKKTFNGAQQTCASDEGRLATIKTEAVFNFLLGLIEHVDGEKDYWFGLNDISVENRWTWSDGTPLRGCSFTKWAPKEPNNGKGNQNCASLWAEKNFLWDDDSCNSEKYFICQKGPGEECAKAGDI